VTGPVQFKELGAYVLELAGFQRRVVSPVVAEGRYELYNNYPLQIQAVAASIPQRDDVLRSADRS
jgi:hypothetical protein